MGLPENQRTFREHSENAGRAKKKTRRNLDKKQEVPPFCARALEVEHGEEEEKTKISLITAPRTAIIAPRGLYAPSILRRSPGSLSG